MIELYAITDDPAPPEAPLRAIPCDGLTAIGAPAEKREPTPAALWRHEGVVEALMEQRDLLPMRYGTVVRDERAAAQAIAERREELLARLDSVRGAVELAVRAEPREPEEEAPQEVQGGSEYMRAKARRVQAAALVHEPLASLSRDSVVQGGPELLRAAYLVDRAAVDGFVALVRRLQHEHPQLDLLCTGPWPPYSFAEGARR